MAETTTEKEPLSSERIAEICVVNSMGERDIWLYMAQVHKFVLAQNHHNREIGDPIFYERIAQDLQIKAGEAEALYTHLRKTFTS